MERVGVGSVSIGTYAWLYGRFGVLDHLVLAKDLPLLGEFTAYSWAIIPQDRDVVDGRVLAKGYGVSGFVDGREQTITAGYAAAAISAMNHLREEGEADDVKIFIPCPLAFFDIEGAGSWLSYPWPITFHQTFYLLPTLLDLITCAHVKEEGGRFEIAEQG